MIKTLYLPAILYSQMQKRIGLHILFWLAYISFKAYINFNYTNNYYKESSPVYIFWIAILVQTCLLLVKLPLVYTLFYIIDLVSLKKWKIKTAFIYSFILFATAILFYVFVEENIIQKYLLVPNIPMPSTTLSLRSIIAILFVLGFACGAAITVKLIRTTIRQKENENEIIKQKLETELIFLKSQTNPHFLFNTLNNIYALARKKSDDTADAVMKLSTLLRFMLYESKKSRISIAEEIKIIDDYIQLEKIRYRENLQLTFTKSIDDDKKQIAPLILLPFVENAFKHGASENRFGTSIQINLQLSKGWLHFEIQNSKSDDKTILVPGDGLGLKNVKRQLELTYPDHQLIIDTTYG
ncbi:MAG: sensor histidine kinase, partial [Saprospiraceae bacterium]|nr:sensor histidine kinase [Saprospiraceae bacterium]